MSSTFLTTGNTKLIEHLLDEIYESWVQRGIDVEQARAELFARAHDIGARIDTNFGRRLGNQTGGADRGDTPYLRQEHMLPSPDEELNAAAEILPISTARHTDVLIIGRNFSGEAALIRWLSDGPSPRPNGFWARCDNDEPFAATHWIPSTWTADEERKHSGRGAHEDANPELLSRLDLQSAIAAFLTLCQVEAGAVSAATAADAIRRIFPNWKAAGIDLATAIAEEALRQGFPIDEGVKPPIPLSLENWENEGGAVAEEKRHRAIASQALCFSSMRPG